MKSFNRYAAEPDFEHLRLLFEMQGEKVGYARGEQFAARGEQVRYLGYVVSGIFRYACVDRGGEEHVVGYAFADECVGDYRAFVSRDASQVRICALSDAVVLRLHVDQFAAWLTAIPEAERVARRLAETLFGVVYDRLLDFYRLTPRERYTQLMHDHPQLKELVSLREIASFIGVTPETVSHIRRNLLRGEKF